MKDRTIFGLVCAGGGAHGAYQVGVLKYIHEYFSVNEASPFQVFTGTSCGALNTSFYATQSHNAHASRLWLEELWMEFHVPAYHGNMFKIALQTLYSEWRKPPEDRRTMWSILDPTPMMDIIKKGFLREHLEHALSVETTLGIAISATELVSGQSVWFLEGRTAKPWNLFHSTAIVDRIGVPHIAASCSVPIFLPPVKVGARYYLDGSISLERPFSAAISMGATRILSISTQKQQPLDLPIYEAHFKPRLKTVIRMLLNRLSYDTASDEAIQIQTLNRFYQALAHKNDSSDPDVPPVALFHEDALPNHYRPVEIYLFQPSKRIGYTSVISENGRTPSVRSKATRFMFHEKFIRELINLGYQDASSKHEELEAFFNPEPSRKWWAFFKKSEQRKNGA
ncbi:MAG: patatin-like phospholipase family protein [Candidatus Omnitrophica bacterium]|nr:patatin-like phospholipase family protein [Candidatus Omnitrophota bacterium]